MSTSNPTRRRLACLPAAAVVLAMALLGTASPAGAATVDTGSDQNTDLGEAAHGSVTCGPTAAVWLNVNPPSPPIAGPASVAGSFGTDMTLDLICTGTNVGLGHASLAVYGAASGIAECLSGQWVYQALHGSGTLWGPFAKAIDIDWMQLIGAGTGLTITGGGSKDGHQVTISGSAGAVTNQFTCVGTAIETLHPFVLNLTW